MNALPEDLIWSDAEADIDLETWSPLDLASAERLMRSYAHLTKRIQTVKQNAQTMRADIDRWESETCSPLVDRLAYLDLQLQEMARQYRALDEKRNKTLSVPSGKVTTRTGRPKLTVTDEELLIAFLHNYAAEMGQPAEDFLRVEVRPKMEPIKGILNEAAMKEGLALVADGEAVPGLEVEPPKVNFTVVIADG